MKILILYNVYRMEKCNNRLKESIKKSVKSVADLIDLII